MFRTKKKKNQQTNQTTISELSLCVFNVFRGFFFIFKMVKLVSSFFFKQILCWAFYTSSKLNIDKTWLGLVFWDVLITLQFSFRFQNLELFYVISRKYLDDFFKQYYDFTMPQHPELSLAGRICFWHKFGPWLFE